MGAIQNDDASKVEKRQAPEGQQAPVKPREYIPVELEIPAEFVGQDGTVLQSGTLKITMPKQATNFLVSIVINALMVYDTGSFSIAEDAAPQAEPPAEPPAEQG